MKLLLGIDVQHARRSRPAWGAWIETSGMLNKRVEILGRAPHGARGLKLFSDFDDPINPLVAPRMGRVD